MADLHLSLNNMTLEQKINRFKDDPQKMQEVNDFLNEVFEKAKLEAELKQNSKHKKFVSPFFIITTINFHYSFALFLGLIQYTE